MTEPKKGKCLPQKLYYVSCGIGLFVLIVLMLIYANQMKNKNQIANKQVNLNEVGNQAIQKQDKEKSIKQDKKIKIADEANRKKQTDQDKTESIRGKQEKIRTRLSYDGKAKLYWPIKGNIILPYSMDTTVYFQTLDQYKCNKGMLIEAKLGQDVVAPAKCKVGEISTNDEIGKQVFLELGNEYSMVLGQLKDVKVKVGDILEEGNPIARVAEPTKYYTLEGNHLYMEMLHKDKPVNPLKYLKE